MLYFKSCLRCKEGTVQLGSDNFGSFLTCLTCGYTINSRSIRSNGSIEEPTTMEEDVVVVPGFAPVAVSEVFEDAANGEFQHSVGIFEEEFQPVDIEEDQAAAI